MLVALIICILSLIFSLIVIAVAAKGDAFSSVETDCRGDVIKPEKYNISVMGMLVCLFLCWAVSAAGLAFIFSFPIFSLVLVAIGLFITTTVFVIAIKFAPENQISRAWEKYKAEKAAKKYKAQKVVDIAP